MQKRTFITGGPVVPAENYFVKREQELADFLKRVEAGKYIVIFAPRQTGKTTFFYQAISELRKDLTYIPVALNFEMYSELEPDEFYLDISERIKSRIRARLQEMDFVSNAFISDANKELRSKRVVENKKSINEWLDTQRITNYLAFDKFFREFHSQIPRKVFLIFDEFDGIPQKALKNFLHTLRQIYHEKKLYPNHNYIHSVGIVGVKSIAQLDFDAEDQRMRQSEAERSEHTISPFNIQDQFALPNFTVEQVVELYGQYTQDIGQPFIDAVIELVHEKTAGQPFLVNRLGQILTE